MYILHIVYKYLSKNMYEISYRQANRPQKRMPDNEAAAIAQHILITRQMKTFCTQEKLSAKKRGRR